MATIEELLNNIGEYPVIRDFGTYANYKPESTHKDVLYVATDTKQILLNGEEYVGDFDELKTKLDRIANVESINTSITYRETGIEIPVNVTNTNTGTSSTKPIAIGGATSTTAGMFSASDKRKLDSLDTTNKQLSTEDFTTALKEKLQGLTNYDDSELDAKIEALKSRLDTLLGSGDVTDVIDTYKEIEDFLQGITNTQTLTGLLQEMKSEIVQLCANTYLPLSGGTITGTNDTPFNINTSNVSLTAIGQYYKLNNVNKTWVGYTLKNNYGTVIYNSSSQKYMGIKDDGTPHYNGYKLWHEGNDGSGSGLAADKLDWTTINDSFDPNTILGNNGGKIYVGGGGSTWSNLPSTTGNSHAKTILNLPLSTFTGQLLINSTGQIHFRTGNGTTNRGWKRLLNEDDIAPKPLDYNTNLDTIKEDYAVYYGSNANAPVNENFFLICCKIQDLGLNSYLQIIYTRDEIYTRYYDYSFGIWYGWKKIASSKYAEVKLISQDAYNDLEPEEIDNNTLYCITEY